MTMPIRADLTAHLDGFGVAVTNEAEFTGQNQRDFTLRLRCRCGAEFDMNLDALAVRVRRGLASTPCMRCSRNVHTKERAVAEALERHGGRLLEYANCHRVRFMCRCGEEATTESRTIERATWNGCPHTRSTANPWSEVQEAAAQAGFELLAVPGDYRNQTTPLCVRCVRCGAESMKPHKDMRTGRGCAACSRARAVESYAAAHPDEPLPEGMVTHLQAPAVQRAASTASRASRSRTGSVAPSTVLRVKAGEPAAAPLARPEVRATAQRTQSERYGAATPLQRPEIRARGMAGGTPLFYGAMSHVHGVWHASQHPAIHRKMLGGLFRRRPYVAGPRTVSLLGYEAQFLDVAFGLRPLRVAEDRAARFVLPAWIAAHAGQQCPLTHAILLDCGAASRPAGPPPVPYAQGGRRRVYFPDAEIPPGPLVPLPIVVEVKSTWTFDLDHECLYAKATAVLAGGKRFEAWVLNRHGTVMDIVSADPHGSGSGPVPAAVPFRSHATGLEWTGQALAELWRAAQYAPAQRAGAACTDLLTMPRTPDPVRSESYEEDQDDDTPLPDAAGKRQRDAGAEAEAVAATTDSPSPGSDGKRCRRDDDEESTPPPVQDDQDQKDDGSGSDEDDDDDGSGSDDFKGSTDGETEFDRFPEECGCNGASFAATAVVLDGPDPGSRIPERVRRAIEQDGVRILAAARTVSHPDVLHTRILMRCAHCHEDPSKDFWLTVSQMYTRLKAVERRARILEGTGERNVPMLLCYRCRIKYAEAHGCVVQRIKVHVVREKILAIGGSVPADQGEFWRPRPAPRVTYTCHCGAAVVGQPARRILKTKTWFGCDACTEGRLLALADGVEVSVEGRLAAMRQKMQGLGCTVTAVRREADLGKALAVTFDCHCGAKDVRLTEAAIKGLHCRGCRSCSGCKREPPKRNRKWGAAAAELASVLERTGCRLVSSAPVLATDKFKLICACGNHKETTLQNALRPGWRGCTSCNRKKQ